MRFINRNRFVRGNPIIQNTDNSDNSGGNTEDEFLSPFITMKNRSGSTVEKGFIVRLHEAEEFAFELYPQFNSFQPRPFGITTEGGQADEMVKVQLLGIGEILMDNSQVFIGDYIYNSQTPGLSTRSNDLFTGAIARALTAKEGGAPGIIKALLTLLPK